MADDQSKLSATPSPNRRLRSCAGSISRIARSRFESWAQLRRTIAGEDLMRSAAGQALVGPVEVVPSRVAVAEHDHGAKLPAVVPMVVHHGKTGWKSATKLEQIIDLDADMLAALRAQLPCFEMLLDDLSVARDEELRARSMTELGRLALFCLARAREAEDFRAELGRWGDAVVRVASLPNGVAALSALVSYILGDLPLPARGPHGHRLSSRGLGLRGPAFSRARSGALLSDPSERQRESLSAYGSFLPASS